MNTFNLPDLTGEQCRAARHLIGLRAEDLAARSSLSGGTIKAFETGKRDLALRSLRDIVAAFAGYGVTFDKHINDAGEVVHSVSIARPPSH